MTPTNEQQRVDVPSFFADLLCYLSSRDDLAGYEIPQTEQVRNAVAELIEAVKELSDLYEKTAIDDNSEEFWAINEIVWERVDTALANVGAAK